MSMIKKMISLLMITIIIVGIMNGCSHHSDINIKDYKDKEDEAVVLKFAVEAGATDREEIQDLLNLAAEHGIIIEPWIMPVRRDGSG